jgi:hypothetical protein
VPVLGIADYCAELSAAASQDPEAYSYWHPFSIDHGPHHFAQPPEIVQRRRHQQRKPFPQHESQSERQHEEELWRCGRQSGEGQRVDAKGCCAQGKVSLVDWQIGMGMELMVLSVGSQPRSEG